MFFLITSVCCVTQLISMLNPKIIMHFFQFTETIFCVMFGYHKISFVTLNYTYLLKLLVSIKYFLFFLIQLLRLHISAKVEMYLFSSWNIINRVRSMHSSSCWSRRARTPMSTTATSKRIRCELSICWPLITYSKLTEKRTRIRRGNFSLRHLTCIRPPIKSLCTIR